MRVGHEPDEDARLERLGRDHPSDREQLKTRVRARLLADGEGRISYGAWANVVKGRVPD
jgi:hypothetical protein